MQTILITGASRGLGFEMTKQYTAAGWRVMACCRNPGAAKALKELQSSMKEKLEIFSLDVGDEKQIEALGKQLEKESIDILMNNAGVLLDRDTLLGNLHSKEWLDTFVVNTIGPALLAQALLEPVIRGSRKIIANISSVLGSIGENHEGKYYLYRSSKTALNAVIKNLSLDLKEKNIIVVGLHPGWVQTDMGSSAADITPKQSILGIRRVLDELTMEDSGRFISYEGRRIAW